MKYSPKELKRLAKACRDAGIAHYKDAEIEFTLTDSPPHQRTRKRASKVNSGDLEPNPEIDTDAPDMETLLLWSAQGIDHENIEN